MTAIAERIADGALTDPSLADDAWVPSLEQVVEMTRHRHQRARTIASRR